jgi:hypothetical protein
VKVENGVLLEDSATSLCFGTGSISDVRQREMHITEPYVPVPTLSALEIVIAKLRKHKSPGRDQIPADVIPERGETLRNEINKLINSIWNNKKLPCQWNESIVLPIYKN